MAFCDPLGTQTLRCISRFQPCEWFKCLAFLQHFRFPKHQCRKDNSWRKSFASAVLRDDYPWPTSYCLLQEKDFTNSSMASMYGFFLYWLPTVVIANFAQMFFSSTTFRFFSFPPFATLQMSWSSKDSGCWRQLLHALHILGSVQMTDLPGAEVIFSEILFFFYYCNCMSLFASLKCG